MQKASIKEVLNGSDDTKFVTPKTLSKYFSTKQTGGGGGGSTADLSNYYNKQQTAALIDAKIDEIPEPDLSNYYNKQETDAKIDAIPKTDLSNYYNKTETEAVVTSMLSDLPEPDLTDYYNKSETEDLVDSKIDEIPDVDLSNYYNKSEVDALIEDIPSSGGGDGVDTLPIGSIVEYDGDTVPDGYEEVSDYSTEEVEIGTWIDGKPLYRKVGSITFTSAYNGTGSHKRGSFISSDIDYGTITKIFSSPNLSTSLYNGYNSAVASNIYVENTSGNSNKGYIMGFTNRSDFLNVPFYIVVEYTKTTD